MNARENKKPKLTAEAAYENAHIVANPLQALLQVQMPGVHLNSASGRWPSDQVEVAPFSFDSTNFSVRTDLPALDFDGIGITSAPRDADNYFELRRSGSNTTLKLRNRQELFIGGMNLKFDISSSNGVSGLLAGRLGLEGPPPLNLVQDYTSLVYDSSPSSGHANFESNRFYFGIATRIRFGGINPIAQGCLLIDQAPDPIEKWPAGLCMP